MTTTQDKPFWPIIVAAIGGLLLLLPLDNPQDYFQPSKPPTALSRQIDEVKPEGSDEDFQVMARSIRKLSNTVSTNPKIRQERNIDSDPGVWLRDTMELSYTEGYRFEERYPEVNSVIVSWYKKTIQDGITTKELTERWHELADALE